MLNIRNMGPIEFRKYIADKAIYIFGAGRAMESCLDIYFDGLRINGIVDNNTNLWGNYIYHESQKIEIIGTDKLIFEIKQTGVKNSILMITSTFYGADIVEALDQIEELNGLECFLQVLIRNMKEKTIPFEFTKSKRRIPKTIHYIWIGGKELPDKFKKNIESWRKYNPDYEIIQWDESNYDFNKIPYMKEAYAAKAWGFASNYARLDIIYRYGGVYLDTDVEVIKKLDHLLNDKAFFCMGCADRVNQGCGFGAVAKQPIILDMMHEFEKRHFLVENGKSGKRPGHTFIHPVIKRYGFEICNQYQNRDGIVLYPTEVMSPLTIDGMSDFQSEKTLSIHQEVGTWKTEQEIKGMEKLKEIVQTRI